MKKTIVLTIILSGVCYNLPCDASESAKRTSFNILAGSTAGTEIVNYPSPVADRPFADILVELGLRNISVLVSHEEAASQENAAGGAIRFRAALKNSLAKLIAEAGAGDARKVDGAGTTVSLLGLDENADRGESAAANWVFYLYSPERADNGLFVIVDRKGEKQTYVYPASVSHYSDAVPGPSVSGQVNSASYNSLLAGNPFGARGAGDGAVEAVLPGSIGNLPRADNPSGARGIGSGAAEAGPPGSLQDIRHQAEMYYTNYGANLTFVGYDSWPDKFPVYGAFAKPYSEYIKNARKIDGLRISVREAWEMINGNITQQEAQAILANMQRMGREYNTLVGECIKYVRDGQVLYAQGKATFPSLLYNIQILKGTRRIELYDDKGQKISKKTTCSKWSDKQTWSWGKMGYVTVKDCAVWNTEAVYGTVPDYSLGYGTDGDQVLPHRARMMDTPPTPAFPEVFLQESIKRDQYDMEVTVTCTLNDKSGTWLISGARMRKGMSGSSDSLGGSAGVSGKVGIIVEGGFSVNLNYGHTWSHFQFGQMVNYNGMIGKPCFEIKQ
ncbi:MAG: hypothetical protein NTX59_04215 [Elusimicrobia bacterium]|nr:hypothetical protein [Elusimicrobiota bacterium]